MVGKCKRPSRKQERLEAKEGILWGEGIDTDYVLFLMQSAMPINQWIQTIVPCVQISSAQILHVSFTGYTIGQTKINLMTIK